MRQLPIIAAAMLLSSTAMASGLPATVKPVVGIAGGAVIVHFIAQAIGVAATGPVALLIGLPVDMAMNSAMGGDDGHTISGDLGEARAAGSKIASFECGVLELSGLPLYDAIHSSVEPNGYWERAAKLDHNDHCGRWAAEQRGYFKGGKAIAEPDYKGAEWLGGRHPWQH